MWLSKTPELRNWLTCFRYLFHAVFIQSMVSCYISTLLFVLYLTWKYQTRFILVLIKKKKPMLRGWMLKLKALVSLYLVTWHRFNDQIKEMFKHYCEHVYGHYLRCLISHSPEPSWQNCKTTGKGSWWEMFAAFRELDVSIACQFRHHSTITIF